MGVGTFPTIRSGWQTAGDATAATTRVVNKPTSITTGDLLIIICGSDDLTAGPVFQTKTDWTKGGEAGGTNEDCKIAFYWRYAPASPPATETVTQATANEIWAWYGAISGAASSDPIGPVGVSLSGGATSVNTFTAADGHWSADNYCLKIHCVSCDGGDLTPITFTDSLLRNTTKLTDVNAGTTGNDCCGAIGYGPYTGHIREHVWAGHNGDPRVSFSASDGNVAMLINIKPSDTGGPKTICEVETEDVRYFIQSNKEYYDDFAGVDMSGL